MTRQQVLSFLGIVLAWAGAAEGDPRAGESRGDVAVRILSPRDGAAFEAGAEVEMTCEVTENLLTPGTSALAWVALVTLDGDTVAEFEIPEARPFSLLLPELEAGEHLLSVVLELAGAGGDQRNQRDASPAASHAVRFSLGSVAQAPQRGDHQDAPPSPRSGVRGDGEREDECLGGACARGEGGGESGPLRAERASAVLSGGVSEGMSGGGGRIGEGAGGVGSARFVAIFFPPDGAHPPPHVGAEG